MEIGKYSSIQRPGPWFPERQKGQRESYGVNYGYQITKYVSRCVSSLEGAIPGIQALKAFTSLPSVCLCTRKVINMSINTLDDSMFHISISQPSQI